MKPLLILIIPLFVILSAAVHAQPVIKQIETHSVFEGVFLSVWSRLKTLNPHQRQSAESSIEYTAGIRGVEATGTLIKPYWKDDLSQDKIFQTELKKFSEAQLLMDKGKLKAAAKAFENFIQLYPKSSLLPNALFAKSLSHAGLGNEPEATTGLSQFIDDNPSHPLIADAQQVLQQIN